MAVYTTASYPAASGRGIKNYNKVAIFNSPALGSNMYPEAHYGNIAIDFFKKQIIVFYKNF